MIETTPIHNISERLADEEPVSEKLPGKGEMYIDKSMPYICVYRFKKKNAYFARLLKTQPSYLIASEGLDISFLLEEISDAISKKLDAFLIIEMWPVSGKPKATFEIFCPEKRAEATVNALEEGFNKVGEIYPGTATKISEFSDSHPALYKPTLVDDPLKESSHLSLGIAVPSLYENAEAKEYYSLFYRKFNSLFSETIKRAAFEFIRVQTSNPFHHYLMLGKTKMDRFSAWADKKLAKTSGRMSFLLNTTPVNSAV